MTEPPIVHGGLVASELHALGIDPRAVLDVSVNVNPYGPCDVVRYAIARADLHLYPDPTATPARRALADWLEVDETRVVVGNGAVDLLWTLARAFLRPGDRVMTIDPSFSEMRSAALRVGARVESYRTTPALDFALDVPDLDAAITRSAPRLVYLCSPSNPAGRCTSPSVLADLAARHPETLFVIDLSFLSLSTRHTEAAWLTSSRVVWLRSLTKDHALAGLRIGCAVMPPNLARQMEEERPPWSVNALAQAAAIAIPSDGARAFVAASRVRLLDDRARLERRLAPLPLRIHPSDTIFVLAEVRSGGAATDIRSRLLRNHSVLVRDCTSFALPNHLRIAARPTADHDRLISALTRELL